MSFLFSTVFALLSVRMVLLILLNPVGILLLLILLVLFLQKLGLATFLEILLELLKVFKLSIFFKKYFMLIVLASV